MKERERERETERDEIVTDMESWGVGCKRACLQIGFSSASRSWAFKAWGFIGIAFPIMARKSHNYPVPLNYTP